MAAPACVCASIIPDNSNDAAKPLTNVPTWPTCRNLLYQRAETFWINVQEPLWPTCRNLLDQRAETSLTNVQKPLWPTCRNLLDQRTEISLTNVQKHLWPTCRNLFDQRAETSTALSASSLTVAGRSSAQTHTHSAHSLSGRSFVNKLITMARVSSVSSLTVAGRFSVSLLTQWQIICQ